MDMKLCSYYFAANKGYTDLRADATYRREVQLVLQSC